MKWFFALNDYGNEFENYAKLLKVAVHTAQKFTSLVPFLLYDGRENDLTEWLKKRNVNIINCRSFLYEKLQQIAEKRKDPNYLGIGAGTFLRTEIPQIALEMNLTDKFVLYTDLDVMFLTEVVDSLEKLSPKYFAVAPEIHHGNYEKMNCGVILMNLKNLQKKDARFRAFMAKEIEMLVDNNWDQGAYKFFYQGRFFGYKWDKLPPEFNWKPYWGDNKGAKIIHFHGPKPYQNSALLSENPPGHLKPLLELLNKEYFELSETWEEFYSEIADNS